MWKLSAVEADGVLKGKQAKIFWEAARTLIFCIRDRKPFKFNNSFDTLTDGQKVQAIYKVTRALLEEDIPSPPLLGWNEAAVEAIYRFMLYLVTNQKSPNIRRRWRINVFKAFEEAYPLSMRMRYHLENFTNEEEFKKAVMNAILPPEMRENEWQEVVEGLQNLVSNNCLVPRAVLGVVGIYNNYYSERPTELSDEEREQINRYFDRD